MLAKPGLWSFLLAGGRRVGELLLLLPDSLANPGAVSQLHTFSLVLLLSEYLVMETRYFLVMEKETETDTCGTVDFRKLQTDTHWGCELPANVKR